MRFHPREPREGVNYSSEHPLKDVLVLVTATGVILLALSLGIGFAVESAAPMAPIEWELWAFSALSESLEEEGAGTDPWLQELAARIARAWPEHPYAFRIVVNDDPTANAFAIPGGGILVTRGLIEGASSENEIAFVLGHEMGHFRGRDHLSGLGRAAAFGLLGAALNSLTGIGGPPGLGWVGDLSESRFSRDQETAADEFGLGLIHAQYGHLGGAFDFFRRDADQARPTLDWFSTHPHSDDRISSLEDLARKRGWPLTGAATPLATSNNEE